MEHIAGRARSADKLDVIEEHLHSESLVYPELATGVSVTSGGVWTLGAFTELIPINTIVKDFDIHWLTIENTTDDETYELKFYNGTTLISAVRWSSDNVGGGRIASAPVQTLMGLQKKNSQIQVKLASSGDTETAIISVLYHVY